MVSDTERANWVQSSAKSNIHSSHGCSSEVEKQAKRQADLDKQQKEKTAAMAELYKAKPA